MRISTLTAAAALLALTAATGTAGAQSSGANLSASLSLDPAIENRLNHLSGRLTDASGAGLPGREVVIEEAVTGYSRDFQFYEGERVVATVTTAADGTFELDVLTRLAEETTYAFVVTATTEAVTTQVEINAYETPTTHGVIPIDLGSDPDRVGLALSRERFLDGRARHAVVARGDDFADSLAGTPLLRDGPLLHTVAGRLDAETLDELERVLPSGATVYVLGGTAAVSDEVVTDIRSRGLTVTRLAGASRIETSVAIADEVLRLYPPEGGGGGALLARAWGTEANPTAAWADSVTGGAFAALVTGPLFVTTSDHLHPAVTEALRRHGFDVVYLLGGRSALSDQVEREIDQLTSVHLRVSGADRAATAVAIADLLQPGVGHVLLNSYRADGWRAGLAAAGFAADLQSAMLVVGQDHVPTPTTDWLLECGYFNASALWVMGDGLLVDEGTADFLDGRTSREWASC